MSTIDVSSPLSLPCGLELKNRLVKAALAEDLAEKQDPGRGHKAVYSQWAEGGWGLILTGNVQVDQKHLGTPGDVTVRVSDDDTSDAATLEKWKAWASATQAGGSPALVQLNHPGRQSPFIARKGQALAPSAIPLDFGPGLIANFMRWLAFGTPKEMTKEDIAIVTKQFASGAKLALQAGFAGIQIHAAHGYLISAFLSPVSNQRTDEYGGSPRKRARILKEIILAIREATSPNFCIGVKINSADHQQENGLEESLEQIDEIAGTSLDFIEISGGSYENATMMSQDTPTDQVADGGLKRTDRTVKREAFFIEYAHQVRERYPSVRLVVTGGFRSRVGMRTALTEGGCDMVGVGRPATQVPDFPKKIILNKDVKDEDASIKLGRVEIPWIIRITGVKPLTGGLVTIYYQKELKKLVKSVQRLTGS